MDRQNRYDHRRAFTLLEILIVVVILAVAAGLAVPVVQRAFTSQRISKASSLVRAAMNSARNRSMRSGEVYGFYYFPQTREYRIAPFNQLVFERLRSREREEVESGSNSDYNENRLPQGIVFLNGDVLSDDRSESVQEEVDVTLRNVTPVLFYPDGTSQSAKVVLRCDEEYTEILLRGLTGSSRAVPVDSSRAPRN